jgi:hypothetical protein
MVEQSIVGHHSGGVDHRGGRGHPHPPDAPEKNETKTTNQIMPEHPPGILADHRVKQKLTLTDKGGGGAGNQNVHLEQTRVIQAGVTTSVEYD